MFYKHLPHCTVYFVITNKLQLHEQTRLEQAVSEVARLRKEKGKLMDLGNEMRAALNRVERTSYCRICCG